MTTFRMIPLTNPGLVADEYWQVRLDPNEQEWRVLGIDIYWDKSYRFLKAEDIQVSGLPVPVRTSLYLELENWVKARRQRSRGLQRLLHDIGVRESLQLVDGAA